MTLLNRALFSSLALGLTVLPGLQARADGTETLGAPSIAIAPGTALLSAGVGLENAQPADISIDVPAGAAVQQVLLYWSHEDVVGGDDTIEVNGVEVTGTLIGGPAFFFTFDGNPVSVHGFRADITALGLVAPGPNTLTLDGLDAQVSTPGTGAHGAGVLVIVDDGSAIADIQIRDGVDLAYCGFPEPRQTTVPQTFSYAVSPDPRIGELTIFAGSVSPGRHSEITLDFDDGTSTSIFDAITADEGPLFDVLGLDVDIPAGSSSVMVSVQSANDAGTCTGTENQSITWLAGALDVQPPPPPAGDGCTPGYWKQRHHLDSWVGFSPADDFEAVFGVDASFDLTLRGALAQGGGGEIALGRHAVAALLNSANPDVDYFFTTAEVIALVQQAYATGDFEGVKNLLEAENERGCPLN